jgi:hypothetical protein
MQGTLTLTGSGTVVRRDGSLLEGPRQYSFLLVRSVPDESLANPIAVAPWIEIVGTEARELEGQPLVLLAADGRRLRFRLIDVSDIPPYYYTLVVDGWPEG